MLKRLLGSGRFTVSIDAWKARVVFWAGAGMVGLVAAFFAEIAVYANELFRTLLGISPYLPFLVAPGGLVLTAWLTKRYFPGSQGSGIPQAIAALDMREQFMRERLLSMRIVLGKILLTVVGLLSGASIGREGPTVHVGVGIMFYLGRLAKFPHHYMDRGLILAGGAAGIAAAFNTPIAGIVFAIEELSRSFEERTSGTLLTAVLLAGITSIAVLGNYTYFGSTNSELGFSSAWLAVLICGVAGGLLGGLFSFLIIWGTRRLRTVYLHHPLLLAGICGLIIALVGLLSGDRTFGSGYYAARELVLGTGTVSAWFPYLKMVANLASYLSGIPGGLFAPALAAGAGLGAHIAEWFPHAPASAIVILGMVGYFSGVVQTPITAFVIVMEMTNNHGLLLPLMATSFIGYLTSRLVQPTPIYQALSENFRPAAAAEPQKPTDASA
ncbi:MAG: chloride channel protein [Chromatiales bacterium 21-64-14]|nr:MAG: chloride channel protein [Chromatiales bacterium 21-64-14]HQU16600.1 chloride channel protein [Gammaproteobacteria bacterium]